VRLGAPVSGDFEGPREWAREVRARGYSAAYCPVDERADEATVAAYAKAAAESDIVIAEVGAWSNPMSRDEASRREAIQLCKARLALADRIGARCCVNIAGSRGEYWHGPDPADLTDETFELIVRTVREIIDAARPVRACYTLEGMPWLFPDSPDSYLRLIEAVARERFACHLDPVNWVSSPRRYFGNADLVRESFARLGPYVRSCHAKDIALDTKLTVRLSEVAPGEGALDYRVFLEELAKLERDAPLMLEHLGSDEEYARAADHIRRVAREIGVEIV
jgi:sugar phosphate isomerase/epimerase